MSNITEQLVTLALQPNWDNTPSETTAELQQALTTAEQALLKEKIVCFVFTPAPEKIIPDSTLHNLECKAG